jgi:hypothetical protein
MVISLLYASDKRKKRRLKAWLFFAEFLLTLTTLTSMMMRVYILTVIIKTPKNNYP